MERVKDLSELQRWRVKRVLDLLNEMGRNRKNWLGDENC